LIVAARILGPEGFGKFTVAYALATLLGAALDLGVPAILTRRVARAPGAAAREWATAAVLKLAVLAPVGLVYALIPRLTHRPWDTTLAVWLLGLAIALQAFIELAVAVFAARQSLRYELGVRLVEKGVLVVAGLGGLWVGGGLAGRPRSSSSPSSRPCSFWPWAPRRSSGSCSGLGLRRPRRSWPFSAQPPGSMSSSSS